jgi:very-short-patch-repair endonuclease
LNTEDILLENAAKRLAYYGHIICANILAQSDLIFTNKSPRFYSYATREIYNALIDESSGDKVVDDPRYDELGYPHDDKAGWYFHYIHIKLIVPKWMKNKVMNGKVFQVLKNVFIEMLTQYKNRYNVLLASHDFLTIEECNNIEEKDWQQIYRRYFIKKNILDIPVLLFGCTGLKPNVTIHIDGSWEVHPKLPNQNFYVLQRPLIQHGIFISHILELFDTNNYGEIINILSNCISSGSERNFFNFYYNQYVERFKASSLSLDIFPALLPQVYINLNTLTHKQLEFYKIDNGIQQIVDFLLILPNQNIIVIEIDGDSHFTVENNPQIPSLNTYEKHLKKDRHLRLQGYEVYRFGNNETNNPNLLNEFFNRLFSKYLANYD